MKKKLLIVLGIAIGIYFVSTIQFDDNKKIVSNEEIKNLHKENLEKSPFNEQLKLSKKERKANGLPPNKYNEERWELTMNPALGRPTTENLDIIRKEREAYQSSLLQQGRVPGDAMDNGWLERGPNNVGGRTRALMFDPNDTDDRTVFAGGVSGGLWKNANISSASSVWTQVDFPEHVNVATITADPNNPSIFYVGTGESYVSGQVNGNGVWKSTDAGVSWTTVLGGISGASYFQSATSFTVNSPAGIAGDYPYLPTTNFGSVITSTITADIILANDATGVATEGCTDFGPNAAGKIAIIRRGNCAFVDKVKNAQNNGAIAAIVMNNVAGDPIPMGGDDATITIPAIMISKGDGDLLETALGSGNVNISITPAAGDFTGVLVPGIQHIHDVKIKDNAGTSDIYVAAGDSFYQDSNATTYLGGPEFGLYKSSDGGDNWTELTLPVTANGNKPCPNDIEIDVDGTIWVSTINSVLYGDGGGEILKSTDNGATFTLVWTVAGADRTQIAVSATAAGKVYVLAELTAGGVTILKTESAFVPAFLVQTKALPNDADGGITSTDFTRGQAFYDLMLEVDPINDEVVYTGGIDLFKSINGATAWSQFSHWYGGFGFQEVHADQHILAFGTDPNKIIMGNDGGVYYSEDGGTNTESRNNGYNTAQFYTVGVAPTTAFSGDYFAGGLQDNGTQLFQNANQTGPDSTTEPYGGDGAHTFFDQDGTDQYFVRNYVYNSGINLYNFAGSNVTIEDENASNGAFINPQALDSNLDILYSNYSAGGNFIVRRYSGIKSAGTLTKTELTDAALTTTPVAFTVSPYTTTSSKLLVGSVLGDVLLVENADGATPIWTGLDGNALVGSVSDLEFGQTENDIFVTMHNYGVINIWYSNDGGTTWLNKEGNLPDVPVNTILQNPLNTEQVIIGTDLGVWFTDDFSSTSPTWLSAFNGMSNTIVLDLDLRDDNMVFAATYGRGVFSGMFTADPFLGIDENELTNGINIYPTVSNGEFTVKAMQNFGNANLNVFNINGQKVYSSELELSNNTQQVNLNLASGMYLAQFTIDNTSVTKKIIIK